MTFVDHSVDGGVTPHEARTCRSANGLTVP
jgi:hypothetical protein